MSAPGSGREGLTFKAEIDLGNYHMRTAADLAGALRAVAERVEETCDSEIDNTEAPRNIITAEPHNKGVVVGWWAVVEEGNAGEGGEEGVGLKVEKRKRPASRMGSASPRYELHTVCCGNFLAADDSIEKLEKNAASRGIETAKLIIYDLGPKK